MPTKAKIFIGSSVEGLTIAYAIQQNLLHDAEVTIWSQGVFELSQFTLESLLEVLERMDFAVFVFTPDDIVKIKKEELQAVRDNVLFELGLFMGRLGRKRSFIVMPDNTSFHIPTDLIGLNPGKYETGRTDSNNKAATGPVCSDIRNQIKKEGLLHVVEDVNTTQKSEQEETDNESIKTDDWWTLVSGQKFSEAITSIDQKLKSATDPDEIQDLNIMKFYSKYKLEPQKAKEDIQKYLSEQPERESKYATISRLLMEEDEFEIVKPIIEKGISLYPDSEKLLVTRADFLNKIGQTDEAIELLKSGRNYINNEHILLKLTDFYEESFDKPNWDEAFKYMMLAYKNNQSSKSLIYRLGRIASEVSRINIVLYCFKILTTKYPETPNYWGYYGNACHDVELLNKAMKCYKKGWEQSNFSETWIAENIGNLLKNRGLLGEAHTYLTEALKQDPTSAYALTRVSDLINAEEEEEKTISKLAKEGLKEISSFTFTP